MLLMVSAVKKYEFQFHVFVQIEVGVEVKVVRYRFSHRKKRRNERSKNDKCTRSTSYTGHYFSRSSTKAFTTTHPVRLIKFF